MQFAYYPGCTAKGSTQEIDIATNRLAQHLGIELIELVDAGCCGSCEIKAINPDLHLMLNARILALAGAQDLEILTVCDTCQANLIQTSRRLETDEAKRNLIIGKLKEAGVDYRGLGKSRHLLRILLEDCGREALRARVVKPLKALRVASFACCHTFRGQGAESQNRGMLETMIEIAGAEAVAVRGDGDCCGFHILMVNEELAARAAGRFLSRCLDARADCVVTSSPLCHTALDIYQKSAEQAQGRAIRLPVLHIEQLIALSFGIPSNELGLDRHMVPTKPLLARVAA
ncbi:MAG: CoB--CoM heterodisulfide reductase iron-sulfur subunit B family protein [Hyphomicrobiales bacterium]|nr:CoB--CoM heterodisulfide reductase iron-sulfur subunit B family protein [Hyphomicrobiales bacterium]